MHRISGRLETITQSATQDDGAIFILGNLTLADRSTTTIAGILADPTPGTDLVLSGKWIDHERHGHLFRFFTYNIATSNPDHQPPKEKVAATQKPADENLVILTGELKNIRYQAEKDSTVSFMIAEIKTVGEKDLIPIVGEVVPPSIGDQVEVTGVWDNHPKFGRQFKIHSCCIMPPNTEKGIKAALSSGRVRGIGPKLAERIVNVFGMDTFKIIEEEPERLREVPGIGKDKAQKIRDSYQEQQASMQIMAFLQEFGISPIFATKIYRKYGADAVAVVKQNPYQLAEDIHGVGFKAADRIAQAMGYDARSPFRINAGIIFKLTEKNREGHVYYPYGPLTVETAEMLSIGTEDVHSAIERLNQNQDRKSRLVIERIEGGLPAEDPVWDVRMMRSEITIARKLKELAQTANSNETDGKTIEKGIKAFERQSKITLAQNQKDAIATACRNKVCVITGGPGTGKTTLIKCITSIYEQQDKEVIMCAPTGRAANRMTETTGHEAGTIHRLLEFSYEGFQRNEDNPLEGDLVIVDETSMVDTHLMRDLLKAVPGTATLVMVGDIHQLPSVGPGNVLSDIITAGIVDVVRLNHIFRQSERSVIVANAHKINTGEMPDLPAPGPGNDFDFYAMVNPVDIQKKIVDLVQKYVQKFRNLDNCQVLTPMHRGPLGTQVLNDLLQNTLNKETLCVERGTRRLKLGDKVMQIRNNYTKEVFNGDTGRIIDIDQEEKTLAVNFGTNDRPQAVDYDFSELDELVLAYACTIHKSQGSEYETVIMPISTQHYIMLARNLIYTGVTRGKKKVIMIGSKKAVGIAVQNNKIQKRFTRLKERLVAVD